MSEAIETGDPALIGRRVAGKFRVEKLLGGGAMGAVYRARDTSLERNVALKVMHPAIAVDPSFVKRFHREARAASRVDHANAMRVIEFGEEPDGLLYIAMEFLQGRDLYKVIHEDWPLPEARITDIMAKALAAMAVAHDMGVIHRDLKPENIMILDRKDDEGHDIVKVCDFGIAKIAESEDESSSRKATGAKLTTSGLVVGTPEYMSPEQARGEKLDARSDLYSLGIILYQLLTGRVPFLAETALAVVLKHITDAPEPPSKHYPNVHRGLESVCMKALAKTKEERWQSAREMRTALRAAMDGRAPPVDTAAVTESLPAIAASDPVGTLPTPSRVSSQSGPAPALGPAKTTPLGTSVASDPPKKSGRGVVLAIVAMTIAVGVASFFLFVKPKLGQAEKAVTTTTTAPSATTEPAKSAEPPASATATATAAAPSAATSATTPDVAAPVVVGHPRHHEKTAASAPISTSPSGGLVKAPEPVPTPTPTPEPPLPPAPPAPTVVVPAPPPAAPPPPPWTAAACKATVTNKRSTSAYFVKDLTLSGTDAAWTGCAKSAIASKPRGPFTATVKLNFDDTRKFRGATCTGGCDAPLAACIASHTAGTASIQFRGGDVTGDPEFEVQASFTCD